MINFQTVYENISLGICHSEKKRIFGYFRFRSPDVGSVSFCGYSSPGIPFMYRGLPCIYSSAILACLSLLTGGNMVILRVTAVAMILFMVNQGFYPHDRVLESQAWKKVVYAGGNTREFLNPGPGDPKECTV